MSPYRVGWPAWKLVARAGLPVAFRVCVYRDDETGTFWADSPDLDGFVVTGADLEELKREASQAAQDLLDIECNGAHPRAVPQFRGTAFAAA